MKKEFFEMPTLEVIQWEEDVVRTSGVVNPDDVDDIDGWDGDWFSKN